MLHNDSFSAHHQYLQTGFTQMLTPSALPIGKLVTD